jgi:SPX domain protein involved in polyphosphate accumulation
MTPKEEDFMDDLEYELEKIFPGKDKKINDFIVSVFDAYDQPQNDISDIVRSGGEAKLVKHAKRTGLKPLKRAI